jgi:trypsin
LQSYSSGGVLASVSRIIINPSYDGDVDYDSAILKLATSVPTSSTVGYAKIAASGSTPAAGSTATVAGW